jgi:hypothetical protein
MPCGAKVVDAGIYAGAHSRDAGMTVFSGGGFGGFLFSGADQAALQ